MKKAFLIIFASGLILMACSQSSVPPKDVQAAFTEKFNTVKGLKWSYEDDEWEAEFRSGGKEMSASFDENGNWLETETKLKNGNVPENILKTVDLKFNGWETEEIERIEKPDYNGYEIILEKEESETEILISDAGEIIMSKVTTEGEDADGD